LPALKLGRELRLETAIIGDADAAAGADVEVGGGGDEGEHFR